MTPDELKWLESRKSTNDAKVSRALTQPQRKERFLEAYRVCGNVTASAVYADTARDTILEYRKKDPVFEKAYLEAKEMAVDRLEEEARRRAHFGVAEPIVHQGQMSYRRDWLGDYLLDENGEKIPLTINRPSDRLLELMLKAARPDKYRENVKVDATVRGGVLLAPRPASAEEWEAAVDGEQSEHRGGSAVTVIPVAETKPK